MVISASSRMWAGRVETSRSRSVGGAGGRSLSKVSDTSAIPSGDSFSLPLKITASMASPRRCFGLCSPSTQRMASTMFDLPQPFGPTTPVTPEGKSRTVRWGNDLNPTSSSCLIRIPLPPHRLVSRSIAQEVAMVNKLGSGGGRSPIYCGWRLFNADAPSRGGRTRPLWRGSAPRRLRVDVLRLQLGVPVGGVDRRQERQPLAVAAQAEGLEHERGPLRPARRMEQPHAGFPGRAATLAAVAGVAGADDIFPDRGA